jgi:hypothetical protein
MSWAVALRCGQYAQSAGEDKLVADANRWMEWSGQVLAQRGGMDDKMRSYYRDEIAAGRMAIETAMQVWTHHYLQMSDIRI